MIVRTEFSYRAVFGSVPAVVARLPPEGGAIADTGCWGHVPFAKECARVGKRAVLGARFSHAGRPLIVLPRSAKGLRGLYAVVAEGADPAERAGDEEWVCIVLGPSDVPGAILAFAPGASLPGGLSGGPAPLPGPVPGSPAGDGPGGLGDRAERPAGLFTEPAAGRSAGPGPTAPGGPAVAFGDNLYPSPGDRTAWLLMLGRLARQRAGPGHILSPEELRLEGARPEWIEKLRRILAECDTPLPRAENVRFPVPDPARELSELCRAELIRRGLNVSPYSERLEKELGLIAEKKFADYFLVIWDMLRFAKAHMLVGPARGSSAGSLVCWLTRITEIDPLAHGLIFERFVDANRLDLPDIDIDFPDDRRHLVLQYLRDKYGEQNVANIGTVIRYKPKSALTDVAKQARIPLWELDKLKDVMIERSSGDSRVSQCLEDSLTSMEVGRALLAKYPVLRTATRLEDHARSAGMHAAGWIVCNEPVRRYCGVSRDGCAQIDKKMAETLNMLKIDALGLRTLSIVEEACELAGVPRDAMYALPLDDERVFTVLNERRYSGIFQFEGPALQSVAKQIAIDRFSDISAITALARPGPLNGGETARWIAGKNAGGGAPMHPALAPYTAETFGCVIYQETVMQITREMGGFSWADTMKIRKLMSARQGDEAFSVFEEKFLSGAQRNGIPLTEAQKIWKAIHTFGSWSFNKSHAVAYGLLSYWTAWLKAYHPLQFAVANLRHAKDEDGAMRMLRETTRENPDIRYTPVDPLRSTARWEFAAGELLGPLTGLPGVGSKTALEIESRRTNGIPLTPRQIKLLSTVSVFADHSPAHRLFGDLYAHPTRYFKNTSLLEETSVVDAGDKWRRYAVLGRLIRKDLRDLNDEKYISRRNGRRLSEELRFILLFYIEDDSGQLLCCVNGKRFAALGKRIVEEAPLGKWFAVKGRCPADFRMLQVEAVKWLEEKMTPLPGTEGK